MDAPIFHVFEFVFEHFSRFDRNGRISQRTCLEIDAKLCKIMEFYLPRYYNSTSDTFNPGLICPLFSFFSSIINSSEIKNRERELRRQVVRHKVVFQFYLITLHCSSTPTYYGAYYYYCTVHSMYNYSEQYPLLCLIRLNG